MAQFIIRPAIMDLTGAKPGTPEFASWAGQQFYVPAFAGGIFGLLGGYLTDRLGRRRVLTWSICSTPFRRSRPGFRLRSRCCSCCVGTTFVGVCVEFVAAVAWLAELFPEPAAARKRAGLHAGLFLVRRTAGRRGLLRWSTHYAERACRPSRCRSGPRFLGDEISDPHAPWRYTLMSGLIPAHSVDRHSAVLARVAGLGPEASGRHAAAAEHLANCSRPSYAAPRSSPRSCSPAATEPPLAPFSRFRRSCPACRRSRRRRQASRCRAEGHRTRKAATSARHRKSADWSAGFCWPFWRFESSAAGSLLRVFQVPGLIVVPLVVLAVAATAQSERAARSGHSWPACSPWPSSVSGATTCRASTRCTCAARARVLPRISAAA